MLPSQRLRQTEIEDLHRAGRRHLDVGGFYISVGDVFPVGLLQAFSDLAANGERFRQWQGACAREGLARHQLHHETMYAAGFLHPVNGGNVGMIQRGQQTGLAPEARQAVRITREGRRKNFERDITTQFGIAGAIYFPHSAFCN